MCRVLKLDISSTEKLVLMAMADHAHKDGTGCYASVDTLAKETSLTRRTVQLTIDKLEGMGLVVPLGKVRRGRRVDTSEFGRGVTMEYKIALPDRPEAKQKGEPKGRTTFTLSPDGKGEPRSQKGRTTFARKGEPRSPESKTLNQVQNQQLKTSLSHNNHHHHQSSHNTPTGNPDDDDERERPLNSKQVIPEPASARIRRFKESAVAKSKSKYGDRFSETFIREILDDAESKAASSPNSENFFLTCFENKLRELEIEVVIEKEPQRESKTLTPDTSPPNKPAPSPMLSLDDVEQLLFDSADMRDKGLQAVERAQNAIHRKVARFANKTGEFRSEDKCRAFAEQIQHLLEKKNKQNAKRARRNERNRERYKKKHVTHDDLLKDKINYGLLQWGGRYIVVRTGGDRREIISYNTAQAMTGCSAEHMAEHLRADGLWAEVYTRADDAGGKTET